MEPQCDQRVDAIEQGRDQSECCGTDGAVSWACCLERMCYGLVIQDCFSTVILKMYKSAGMVPFVLLCYFYGHLIFN